VFELIQILYWLALSTWFGGVLFIAVTAPVVVRTVRQHNPVLTDILSVNLEGQHGTLLAGAIVGGLMGLVIPVELVCSAVMFVALIGHWVLLHPAGSGLVMPALRTFLYIAAVVLLLYQWRVVWPRVWKARQEYLDHADEPEVANPALDRLERYQSETATVIAIRVALLLAMILFSANLYRTVAVPTP